MSKTYTLPADSTSSIMDESGVVVGPYADHEPACRQLSCEVRSITGGPDVEHQLASGQCSHHKAGILMGYDPAHKRENEELLRRLAEASSKRKPTRQERRQWKVSFVLWMIGHKPGITREFVEEILDESYGL